jgi:hypothetical protein
MFLHDTIMLDGVRKTSDGFLVGTAKVARTGIQIYAGHEVGRPDLAQVRVFRPEAEVFHKDALHSFAHRPMTLDHPPEMVTADNWRTYAVGSTGDEIARDGEAVRVPLVLMDAKAISAVDGGKRELSMGYFADLKWEAGKTPGGEEYDAMQTNIRGNHLAVVTAARAGSAYRIGDENQQGDAAMSLRKIMIDGISIETTDQGAEAITKLQGLLDGANKSAADALKAKDTAEGALAAAATAHKSALDAKDGEIAALKTKIPDAKAMDAAIQARAKVIADAKVIAGDKLVTDGKTDAEIRRGAVATKHGDEFVKDRSDDYVAAAFDALVKAGGGTSSTSSSGQGDTLRQALQSTVSVGDARKEAETAYDEMVKRQQDAWRGPQKAA